MFKRIGRFFKNLVRRMRTTKRRVTNIASLTTHRYPTQVDINTITWSPDPYVGNSDSPYGGAVTPITLRTPEVDPETGAYLTRVGDESTHGSGNTGHNYSSTPVWNCENNLILIGDNPAYILADGGSTNNPDNYQTAYTCNPPSWARWSNLDPFKMFGTQNGDEFVSMDIRTDVRTTLHTFTGYSNLSIGDGEGKQDRNDQYICLIGIKSGNKHIVVYDIINDTFDELDLGSSASDLDSATVSPLGNYVVLTWKTDGTGAEQGFQRYDIDLTNRTSLYAWSQHDDIGIDFNGDEVLVTLVADPTQWSNNNYIVMVRLSDGLVTPIFNDTDGGIWGAHFSVAAERNGFVYVSENLASNEVVANRCFALPLDPSSANLIEIYGSHHSNRTISYLHEAKVSVNRTGTKMCFDTNLFNDTLEAETSAPAHILEFPQ